VPVADCFENGLLIIVKNKVNIFGIVDM